MGADDLRRRADDWVRAARAAYDAGLWTVAYYLAGYAIEFALKACVLTRMPLSGYVFANHVELLGRPKALREVNFRTHDLKLLIDLAYLRREHTARANDGSAFGGNWGIVKDWDSQTRYDEKTQGDADDMLRAVTDPQDGVLTWLRNYWLRP